MKFAWPLERNHIRRGSGNNAFGMVRNGGHRPHQGWDLVAPQGTPCYAITDGIIDWVQMSGDLGKMVLLAFEHRGKRLYAAYCHLSLFLVAKGDRVERNALIGLTGNTGNAKTMRGEDQHLHFEIRTIAQAGRGLQGRIDPATLFGPAPAGLTVFDGHGGKVAISSALGLKVPGINVLEDQP